MFFISAAAFGSLSIWGYTTRRNMSGFGTFLVMGVIGIVIANLVNLFLRSSEVHWIISVVGVGSLWGSPLTTPSGSRGCTIATTTPFPRAARP